MKIKEVEALTGLTRANIRFYESKGLLTPARGENNYREYTEDDVERLRKIVLLRRMDIAIEQIQKLFDGTLALPDALAQAQEELTPQIERLEGSLELCQIMQQRHEQLDNLPIDEYDELVRNRQREGQKFREVWDDILEEYQETVLKQWMGAFRVRGSYVWGLLFVFGVFSAMLIVQQHQNQPDTSLSTYIEIVMIPVILFILLTILFWGQRLLQLCFPRVGKWLGRVVYWTAWGVMILIAGGILFSWLNYHDIVHIWMLGE